MKTKASVKKINSIIKKMEVRTILDGNSCAFEYVLKNGFSIFHTVMVTEAGIVVHITGAPKETINLSYEELNERNKGLAIGNFEGNGEEIVFRSAYLIKGADDIDKNEVLAHIAIGIDAFKDLSDNRKEPPDEETYVSKPFKDNVMYG